MPSVIFSILSQQGRGINFDRWMKTIPPVRMKGQRCEFQQEHYSKVLACESSTDEVRKVRLLDSTNRNLTVHNMVLLECKQ